MYCKALNKNFDNKAQMFAELKANKDLLIRTKKSEIKTKRAPLLRDVIAESTKALTNKEGGFIYPIISNTNYLDSHDDVHLNNSMNKTVSEQQGKVYYVADHKLEVSNIIATPKNVEMILQETDFSEIGVNGGGQTQLLTFKIAKENIMHEKAKQLIEAKEPLQNSIRMRYINIDLAVNDNSEEFKEEYKVWEEVYPKIVNKQQADERGYFFAVRELAIVNEGSMVLFGSNDATPIKEVGNTSEYEPPKSTQSINDYLKNVEIKFN